MIKFPSIEQFRNVIKHVQHTTYYEGVDADGNVVMNRNKMLPTLKFQGTVKLHGTNAAYAKDFVAGTDWCQSRERVITPISDNAGCATFIYAKKEIFDSIADEFNTPDIEKVVIFFEWCGGNIQSGVALSELPKMAVIFAINVIKKNGSELWIRDTDLNTFVRERYEQHSIYAITRFPTWMVDIDFNNPQDIQNRLCEITEEVEKCCPVGKEFGIEGVGEGVVWACIDEKYIDDPAAVFKVKGQEHSSSKVKKLASVDVEKVATIKECVEVICTENRMRQGIAQMEANNQEIDVKNTGIFIKWLTNDCIKEELDTIIANGLIPKDVVSQISNKGRAFFINEVNSRD